jgi:hypothetical protein
MKPPKKSLYNKFMSQFRGLPCEMTGQEGEPHHIVYKSRSGHLTLVAINMIPLNHENHMLAHNDKLAFFDWLDDNYPGRLDLLNNIKKECQRLRLSHEEIYEKWGKYE